MLGELHRTGRVIGVLLTTALLLSGCSLLGGQDEAEKFADRVATALTKRELGGLRSSGTQKDLDAALVGAAGYRAKVTAGDVKVDGSRATATLRWSWQTPQQTWSYRSKAALRKVSGGWQLQWAPSVVEPRLAAGEGLEISPLRAARGEIRGQGGSPIVVERKVRRLGIDKAKLRPPQYADSARRLATALGLDPKAYADALAKTGPKAFVQALVVRESDMANLDENALAGIPGYSPQADELALAPTRRFAAPILGTVGAATAEVVKKSKGRIKAGDVTGLSGLQLRYDDQLAGTPGVLVEARDPNGPDRELFRREPIAGKPLDITLDPALQTDAEDALEGVPSASALVAIKPSTGAILAAASGPGSKGYNTATFGQYAPGSTFKVVTSLALLRAGLTPDSEVDCSPTVRVSGKRFKNYDDYPSGRQGRISLRTAVANSCNTALINTRAKLGNDSLTDAAQALGVGDDLDAGFPAYFGQAPAPASETEKAADMIGQGKVLASPMSMAAVAASVMKGARVTPTLVSGQRLTRTAPRHPLTVPEASTLRSLMRSVVTEGSGGFLSDIPGPEIGAKTGTAEFGTKAPLQTHAWMIATRGDLAVAVFVDIGESGSRTAGPILERFLRSAG